MAADTSGPAFPAPDAGQHHFSDPAAYTGMTLRDYFAAKAMPEVYGRVESGGFERMAQLSYAMADAMLKERAK